MSDRVIQAVANNPKLMPCFNVPFQSGDNTVLQNMRRGYTRERYLAIVEAIRKTIPDASIVADCIVGFPGETEEQFQATLALMEAVKFEQVNTAAYSPRPNTPAAEWTGLQLSDEVKQDRLQRINRLATEHALKRSLRFVGRVEEVLVEDVNMKNPRQVYGRNPQSRLIYFDGLISELKGKLVQVRVIEAKPYCLVGELL
jgi:tRNA-2-methylthio-N6-dimethylallyladenosine synthase